MVNPGYAANPQQFPQNPAYPQQEQPRAQLMPSAQVVGAWVQGADMAHSMYMVPNQIAFMVDDICNKIYVKRTDQFGRQSPLQSYSYDEPPAPEPVGADMSNYVTRQDFDTLIARFDSLENNISGAFESLAPKRKSRREDVNDD